MIPSSRQRTCARRSAEAGVSLVEMMIAILVLTIGLVTLAQLFVAATLNNTYVVATAGGLNDAQRFLEQWKYVAGQSSSGATDATITSSTYDTGAQQCAAFVTALGSTGYTAASSDYKENVWVFDENGDLVGSADPATPPGFNANELKAPTPSTRLVYIYMEPKSPDPRTNNSITLMAVIGPKMS